MKESFHTRARQLRSRVAIRSWEYRQRHHAKGVWYRLRRVLAEASNAYLIPEETAALLIGEGLVPEPVGLELQPPRTILFVPAERLATIRERVEVALHLDGALLAARFLVLVRFPRRE